MFTNTTKRGAAVLGAVTLALTLSACDWKWPPVGEEDDSGGLSVQYQWYSGTASPKCGSTVGWRVDPVKLTGKTGLTDAVQATENEETTPDRDGWCTYSWRVDGLKVGTWRLSAVQSGRYLFVCDVTATRPATDYTTSPGHECLPTPN